MLFVGRGVQLFYGLFLAQFIDLVDKILAITKDDVYLENPEKQSKVKELEKQIDQLVYRLYGLTNEEITIIEKEANE